MTWISNLKVIFRPNYVDVRGGFSSKHKKEFVRENCYDRCNGKENQEQLLIVRGEMVSFEMGVPPAIDLAKIHRHFNARRLKNIKLIIDISQLL